MSGQAFWRHPERVRQGLAVLFFVGFAFLIAAGLPPTSNATFGPQEPGGIRKNSKSEFVPGEVLVRYRTEAIAKQQTSRASEIGEIGQTGVTVLNAEGREIAVRLERFEGSDIVPGLRIARVAAEDTLAAIEALRRQPNVIYAEPNYLLYLDATPNDPRFLSNELYGLAKIGAPAAWDVVKGSSDTPQAGFGSPRIVVGVVDTGIDRNHEDLGANIWTNPGETPGDGIDNDSNGFIDDVNGYNFFANSGTIPADSHATHVGGTVGAVGNNGIGVVGVNWNVGLMSLKFIQGLTGSTADAIRACNYAKQMRDTWVSSGGTQGANLRVLNNSYGGSGFSQSFLDAINQLDQTGILFVTSAGNLGPGSTEPNNDIVPQYPATYGAPNVISVANTDSSDNLAGSSHFGLNTVHLGAPGQGILSTFPGNTYGLLSGTSMASPHVAGAAALLLAQNPNLTVQQLKSLLIFNGDSVAALLNKTVTGRRLNVDKSFQALAEGDTTPPGTVTNLHVNTQTGRSINLGWTASGDDGALGDASLYKLTFTDATTSAVIPLTTILPAATGAAQAVNIKLPYRHTAGTITLREFDNVGNEGTPATLAVSVSLGLADPYLTSLGSPAALSTGGTAVPELDGDDKLKLNYPLPFTFPFFGENFSVVNISSNGNLFFSAPPTRSNGDADDVPSSVVDLAKYKMISGLWDDLRTDRNAGDDVYVVSDSSHIIFRWQGVTFGNGTPATEFPVNFEVELLPNGTIFTRYGTGNTNIFPVVGIAGGEPDAYSIPSHTSEQVAINLTNAQQVTFAPRGTSTLTVASLNPSSGVNITVTPADTGALGNGTTQFARTYGNGTLVNLTAPATASGNNFLKWQRDGVDYATTAATSLTIDANRTLTAVYVTPRTLTVTSSNPSSGVNITVTPNDNGSLGNGTTPFARTYNDDTVVNLTAPATAGGNNFLKWQRDGVDWATTPATSLTIDANRTMTAVYVTPRTLTVASSNPNSGVSITVTPNDNGGLGNGATPFPRTYNDGITVNLTAPATASGNTFQKWQKDGVDWATTAATSITIDADRTMTAVYVTPGTLTIASSNPNSGVNITVTPPDNGSLGDGTTPFSRAYIDGTVVNLTAPATASGNDFLKWQRNGVDFAATAATSVTMAPNLTMTAVYSARTLTVASSNPSAGVNITVTPDNSGFGNGTTQFTRTYNSGADVSLTAAATAGGNNFLKWQKDGSDFATTLTTIVDMDADHTMTAVYVTPRTVTVASSNPASGVNITVTPADNSSLGNGATPFPRTYNDGTVVNLTAPATAGGNNFLKWQKDGVDVPGPPSTSTSVTIAANSTMTAVYITPRTLTIASLNPNSLVNITVTPVDNSSSGNGATPFARTYNDGTVVNLTAPETANGNPFLKWQRDGSDFPGNTTFATSVTMDGDRTMTAVYTPRTLTVASSNPSSGVNIIVTPADNGSLSDGTTPFARTYNDGTVVNLTAPATSASNNFLKWQRDGVDWATTPATNITIDANRTMTAVYATTRTLTVASSNPSSGVIITATPNDNGGLSSGTTQFTRTYNDGTTVNLTAPASVAGNPFQKWQRDGVDWATTPATSVTMDAPHTMTAVYINVVQFSLPQFNAFEPSSFACTGSPACEGSVTVTVSRSGDSTAPAASVDYTTSDDVATQKGDYIFSAGRLNFAVGEVSKSFTVFTVDDVYTEGTESFKVMLSNPVGTTLGFRSVANVLIFDNDGSGSTAPNPLDNADARFFVRQHYLDFLNREPDADGLDFWRNQITSCGTDQACIQIRRINVSAAFFLSIEFQETGYFVYKMNKSAYGNLSGAPVPVRYVEFLTDTQQIGKGVEVGIGDWQAQLEANTVAFTQDFVSRSAFTTKYPTTRTPAQFVDELFANAGVTPSPEQQAAAINEFSGAPTTGNTAARARALRRVAENPTLNQLELNRAFVLMQYFGYLRRNPNDPPEFGLDFGGYNFWLGKLNEFNGNFINAEMVKAFITAGEYRQRFGP